MARLGVRAERIPLGLDLPGALPCGLALASGVLLAGAFPSWDLGPLAFVGLVPLLMALEGSRPGQAAWLGYAAGWAFFPLTVWWVLNTMITYGRMSLGLSLLALLLLCGLLAAYVAAFAWLLVAGRRWLGLPEGLVPAVAAALWTALEFLRTYLFSGFPWALLGYTQYRQPTIRLLASAVGVYGISALLVLVNATVAGLLTGSGRLRRHPRPWRAIVLPAGILILAVAATLGYATVLWRDPTGGRSLPVALLQGNIDQSLKWERSYQTATLDIYERLVRRSAAEGPALIIWPETAVPFFLRFEPELGGRVLRLPQEAGIPMLIGSPDVGGDRRLYNAVFLVGADGQVRDRYDKRHLVPFGEYVPLRPIFFFLDHFVAGMGDFGEGRTATVFSVEGVRFSVVICYEIIFPAEVRELVQRGAQFLVNVTNDAWFGRSGAPYQHMAMAVMRAVEHGTYLVRAANTGVTAVVAPSGEILASTEIFTEGILHGRIRPRLSETPYTRFGDVLAWGCLVFLGAYGLALFRGYRGTR
jgi:apolipoprotein N-acyltransferase